MNTPKQLGVIPKVTFAALDPLIKISLIKTTKKTGPNNKPWPQYWALGTTPGLAIQPIFYPVKSAPIHTMGIQFLQNATVNSIKGFNEVLGRPRAPKKTSTSLSSPKETLPPLNHPGKQSLLRTHHTYSAAGLSQGIHIPTPWNRVDSHAKHFMLKRAVITAQRRCWGHVREEITWNTWTWRSTAAWETTTSEEKECDLAREDEFCCSGPYFSCEKCTGDTHGTICGTRQSLSVYIPQYIERYS